MDPHAGMIGDQEVMIGYCTGGWVRSEFMSAVLAVEHSELGRLIGRVGTSSAGAALPWARSELCARFLEHPREQWLWMLDTDIVFTPADLAALAEAADAEKRPMLSAVVAQLRPDGVAYPLVYDAERDEAGQITRFAPVRDLPAEGLIEAAGAGAGCLLVHRSVLEAMDDGTRAWFREVPPPDGSMRGEDLSFFVRAATYGFGLHVHCGVRPGHVKQVIVAAP